MKKLIYITMILLTIQGYSQYRGTRQNAALVRTETYVTNSPGNSASNSWLTSFDKDSTAIAWGYPSVQFWKHISTRNDGNPTSIAWFDSNGYLKRSPLPAWITSETDPKWTIDKVNYYDKTTSDTRYLQSFSEVDPTIPPYSKSLTAFNVIKTNTDLLYYSNTNPNGYISSVPAQSFSSLTGKPTTLNGYGITDAVINTRTINNQPLTSNIIITKNDIGLSNIDNTSDLNKPISTATQTALNAKLSAEIDGSITNELQTLSISGNNLSISSGNTITLPITTDYINTATVTGGAGNAIFYLTSDKTSTGIALYTNVNYVNPIINDSSLNYSYSWSYNSTTKALTVNSKAAVGLNVALLSLTLLGVPSNVANGTTVQVLVKGN